MWEEIYDGFTFMPIIGLPGAGKTEILEKLTENGEQAVCIETLLGIRGISLSTPRDALPIAQDEFDNLLAEIFSGLDRHSPVYIEWKPVDLLGVSLPVELVRNVQLTTCIVLPRKRKERLERLFAQYAELESCMETIVNDLSSNIPSEDLDEILWHARSGDKDRFTRFIKCIVDRYFDPIYIDEICMFNGAFIGNINPIGQFSGKFLSSVTREKIMPYVI